MTRLSLGAALAGLVAMSLDSYGYQIEVFSRSGMPLAGGEILAQGFNQSPV